MTVLMQTNKIELEQAKRKAKQMGEEMIEKRLNACTEVYEEEFEILANQFDSLQKEVVINRTREHGLRAKLAEQEAVNTQLNNFMESVGYDLI